MPTPAQRPADSYSPLYFLASVGAGGLAVSFFMYLMFWVPHPGQPVPVFEDIAAAFTGGSPALQAAIVIAVLGIAAFVFLNVKSLAWNIGALARFRTTEGYEKLRNSNAEASILARPLAFAMTINALFIVGLVFVPRLWSIVEYLFPAAMVAFVLVGAMALRDIGRYVARILSTPGAFDLSQHNSFGQLLPAFALAMVGVGLSAPAAMSVTPATVAASLVLSTFFAVAAVVYAVIALITAIVSMLQHGVAKEAAPTLMIVVPLMTVLGILVLRQNHGLHVAFDDHVTDAATMMFLAKALAVQVVFLFFGWAVMRRQGYFADFVTGPKTSPGSYALVCPGVALSVMLHFFINKGLVANGVLDKFGTGYWALTAIALASQVLMVWLVLRLNRQHFGAARPASAVPAE
ncbi:MAG: TsoY family (seleno)protein [Pseudooceanicola sp.]